MSLKLEVCVNYQDSQSLVSPHPCDRSAALASGNGVCYTGEYFTLLKLRGELIEGDSEDFYQRMLPCLKEPGLLTRGPGQPDLEAPDDYYGFLAGCVATDNVKLARGMIVYGRKHWGSYNNVTGKWSWQSFLWRQPQLLCAMYAAAKWEPIWIYPLCAYSALVIAVSCIRTPPDNTDARRLAWLLIKTLSPSSWLCRQASKLWYKRLYRDYGALGMFAVRLKYYKGLGHDGTDTAHPFVTYSVD